MWSFLRKLASCCFLLFKGENSSAADSCVQFWLQTYLQGWKSASGLRDCAEFSREQVLAAFHWRLLDYAETTTSLFRIFFFVCFTSQATDSKSFLPPAKTAVFFTVMVFCLFIRGSAAGIFIRPPHHWWKIPQLLLLTNGWIVDFSCSHGISLCGSWISSKHWAAANIQSIQKP